ncbi:MAG: sulfatase-like hydrolase/transferase, partial [Planctomycetes bacterium]|nr:sulfatase-like hydrolase/transferase [Planctomycetota bacterium]
MSERPNILLLFTDQQRYDTLANTHNDEVRDTLQTPTFDRLCREGTRFDRAYTPNPVCIPARYNMITGLPARYHGHPDNCLTPCPADIPLLPQILSENGYQTHAIGKMHFVPFARQHHGFHRLECMEETPRHRSDDDYLLFLKENGHDTIHQHGVRQLLYHQPQRSLVPEEFHGSHWVADRSIKFLQEAADDSRPFFLKASWIHPHPPYNVPERLCDLYKDKSLPKRIARTNAEENRNDLVPKARNSFELGDGLLEDDERFRRHQELYHASVAFVDEQMGRVLDELDRLGIADNTLVLTASDHGEMLGDL